MASCQFCPEQVPIEPLPYGSLETEEDELAEFGARKPLPAYSLQLNCKAPTALHSWGVLPALARAAADLWSHRRA